jgi:hypothetical protein
MAQLNIKTQVIGIWSLTSFTTSIALDHSSIMMFHSASRDVVLVTAAGPAARRGVSMAFRVCCRIVTC